MADDYGPPVVGGPDNDSEGATRRDPKFLGPVLTGVAGLMLGVWIGWVISPPPDTTGEPGLATTIAPPDPGLPGMSTSTLRREDTSTTRSSTAPSSTLTVPLAVDAESPPFETAPEMELLRGVVVLAVTTPGPESGDLWVLNGGDPLGFHAPLRPGDFPYPLILSNGWIAFTDLERAYVARQDGRGIMDLGEASFLVPGGQRGRIWVVGERSRWFAALDTATGALGDRLPVGSDVEWPLAGVADGLMVRPIDTDDVGGLALWSPALGIQPIGTRDPAQTGVLTAGGNTAVLLSPGGVVDVLDVPTRAFVSTFQIDMGEQLIVDGCLSPDQRRLAVTGSGGTTHVYSTTDGGLLYQLEHVQQVGGTGWTRSGQLIAVVDEGPEQRLVSIDQGEVHVLAHLDGSAWWWMAADGSTC